MIKIASAIIVTLALSTGTGFAQENGSSGNGQNYFERCSPESISEIAAVVNDLSDANPRKVTLSKQAKTCMVRLDKAMRTLR